MNCPNCTQLIEDDAAFCGNCGHQLAAHTPEGKPVGSHIASVLAHQTESGTRDFQAAPSYAVATPLQHAGEVQAVLSVLLGALAIAGAFLLHS
ncbi:MAG: zinc ribbon domain-containing protein [Candidatus Saccharimonadales bacterium]